MAARREGNRGAHPKDGVVVMKKWLTTLASLATIVALLAGSCALVDDGPNGKVAEQGDQR